MGRRPRSSSQTAEYQTHLARVGGNDVGAILTRISATFRARTRDVSQNGIWIRVMCHCLEDWVDENNSVRAVDVFVEALDLRDIGFEGVDAAGIGRPAYHPSPMLKLYIYGYLNRVQSSRRLEREAGRNLEVMWLTGRLAPDHKTIADFRKDNGPAIRKVCARFVELCRKMGLLAKASVAIDGSKFKAVNTPRTI